MVNVFRISSHDNRILIFMVSSSFSMKHSSRLTLSASIQTHTQEPGPGNLCKEQLNSEGMKQINLLLFCELNTL